MWILVTIINIDNKVSISNKSDTQLSAIYIFIFDSNGLKDNNQVSNSIMISINSDDPSVFNTNVSNEFSYIFYSLQEKGYSRESILS